mgnify:CR=1 FL=1
MATTSALVTSSGGNVYTSSGSTVITWLSLTNYHPTDDVLTSVHIVPSGESANVQNQIIANAVITAGDTLQLYAGNEKLILEGSTAVYVIANANSILNSVTSYTSA